MKFVLGEGSRIPERLPNVLFLEVRQFLHDLRWRHPVGDEIDDVCNGDAKPPNRRAAGEDLRIVGDAVERVRHGYLCVIVPAAAP